MASDPIAVRKQISDLAMAHRQSHLLFAAVELDVFTELGDGGATIEFLSKSLALEVLPTTLLLNGLRAIGLVQASDGRYYAAAETRRLLGSGPQSLRSEVLMHRDQSLGWMELTERLRNPAGRSQESYEQKLFAGGQMSTYLTMVRTANAASAEQFVRSFAKHLASGSSVADLGGGHGLHATLLAEQPSVASVTVIDLPKAIAVCRDEVAAHPLRDRLILREGDALDLGAVQEFDALMTSDLLHSFGAEAKRTILANSLKALKPGGVLGVSKFQLGLSDTDRLGGMLFSLKIFLNSGGGYLETDEETIEILSGLGAEIIEAGRCSDNKTAIFARRQA